jgi:4'-phosphopantetheinyl transferase
MTAPAPGTGAPVGILVAAQPEVPQDEGWLGPDEQRVASALRAPKRRSEWLLGRWTGKHAVAAFLGEKPSAVTIAASPDGAPEAYVDSSRAPCAMSIAHRGGLAACAVAAPETALGCDLEVVEPRSDGFIADFLTTEEGRAVRAAADADERDLMANLAWSGKEAVLKAKRTGLRADTRSVEVDLTSPDGSAELGWTPLRTRELPGPEWHGWWSRHERFLLVVVARPDPAPPHELGRRLWP